MKHLTAFSTFFLSFCFFLTSFAQEALLPVGGSFTIAENGRFQNIDIGVGVNKYYATWEEEIMIDNVRKNFVKAQVFNSDGRALSEVLQVGISNGYPNQQGGPQIVVDHQGTFLVIFSKEGEEGWGYKKVVFSRYNESGEQEIDQEIIIDEDANSEYHDLDAAINKETGDVVITYILAHNGHVRRPGVISNERDLTYTARALLMRNLGNGAFSFPISVQDQFRQQNQELVAQYPKVDINTQNQVVITWSEASSSNVYAKHFLITDRDLEEHNDAYQINNSELGRQSKSTVHVNDQGNIVFSWQDDEDTPGADLRAKVLNFDGRVIKQEFSIAESPFESDFVGLCYTDAHIVLMNDNTLLASFVEEGRFITVKHMNYRTEDVIRSIRVKSDNTSIRSAKCAVNQNQFFFAWDILRPNSLSGAIYEMDTPSIGLSRNYLYENNRPNTYIGNISANLEEVNYVFQLRDSRLNANNAFFEVRNINGTYQLYATHSFNYEERRTYEISIIGTDPRGNDIVDEIEVNVRNTNDPITDIELSNNILNWDQNFFNSRRVGSFLIIDEDVINKPDLALVPGAGDEDNAQFSIIKQDQNYYLEFIGNVEFREYSIRVRAFDGINSMYVKNFTIYIRGGKEINKPKYPFLKESRPLIAQALMSDNTVYPNSSEGIFKINFKDTSNNTVIIRDLKGNIIAQQNFDNQLASIDLSSQNRGIYLLEIYNDKKLINQHKIIKK